MSLPLSCKMRKAAGALKLGAPLEIQAALCRQDAAAFKAALGEGEALVACTQEAALFGELAEAEGSTAPIRFVNVPEDERHKIVCDNAARFWRLN